MTEKLILAFILYLVVINTVSAAVVLYDKSISRLPRGSVRRVPEKRFVRLSLVGGAFGTLLAMFFVRHKTKTKDLLMFTLIGILFLWLAFLCAALYIFYNLNIDFF